jgi:hypothetical protein
MMLGAPADLLSLIYAAVALYTLWQIPGRWRSHTDSTYTADDHNLASRIGFLLLTPLGVLLHEGGHMVAATLLGARDISLNYRVYWGYVQYRGQIGATGEWIVASAGPGVSLVLGLVAGYVALRLRPVWRDVGMSFAHATLLLDLILYPGMSVVEGVGDFRWIYSARTPTLSIVAGVVHGAGLIAYIVLARLQSKQAKQEAHLALSAQFDGQQVVLRDEIVARLGELEAHERVRRLEPAEREELNHLRDLREWSVAHNRRVGERAVGEALPHSLPEPEPPSPN